MADRTTEAQKRELRDLGEAVESDNILRWDGERLYVEQDVYQNGQLVHRRYRRTVTEPVARALSELLARSTH